MFTRTYGIEIECILPAGISQTRTAEAITAAGVACFNANYSHSTSNRWKVVSDGSLSGNGQEIVSPPLSGEAGFEQITKVCAALEQLGATVNRSCGLHVHVAGNNLSAKAMRKLAALYIENESVIDSFMPSSRRGSTNHYCGTLRNTSIDRLMRAQTAADVAQAIANGNRYVKLNFSSFWRHGTVEFRHHSGTVDARKICEWVRVCLRMVKTAVKLQDDMATVATTSDRPRNRRLGLIYDLLSRPDGCTRAEVAQALGRRTMPPMNRILRDSGISYTTFHSYRNRRVERYRLQTTVSTATTTTTITHTATLDDFANKLEMQEAEKAFWIARAALLRGASTAAEAA